MALLHYLWSRTAASNASADANVNWAEGQAPSSVNDSARSMMASLAGYRDDIAGAITTGGTSTAYTITSYQVFDTLAHMDGQVIAFTPHATNGATVTLNVDGLGAKPLRSAPSVELLAGTLILGTPYTALYNNSAGVWYLHNFYGNPYSIPLGGGMDYWLPTAPNSSFVFPIGQAISRTTYATLFSGMGTTHGVGDGSTTFNLPDKRGRVSAAPDASAGRLTDATSGFGDTLGEAGGTQTHTLTASEIPSITSSGSNSITVAGPLSGSLFGNMAGVAQPAYSTGTANNFNSTNTAQFSGSNSIAVTSNNTSGAAHSNVQPTIVCNYIIRII
jgi:microcystin-dependent protein